MYLEALSFTTCAAETTWNASSPSSCSIELPPFFMLCPSILLLRSAEFTLMADLQERGDAGLDVGEIDEQHDEAARKPRLLAVVLGHHVHGGCDSAHRNQEGRKVRVLDDADKRVRRV
uniref:Uncharacterized protein n=1 Tax=Arundo donax TaxID=35708 RepID=A0A0A9HIE8_ARUDO